MAQRAVRLAQAILQANSPGGRVGAWTRSIANEARVLGLRQKLWSSMPKGRFFSGSSTPAADGNDDSEENRVRLSKLISSHAANMTISRKEAERLIQTGQVTLAGQVVTSGHMLLDPDSISGGMLKVKGKAVVFKVNDTLDAKSRERTRVWLVNKMPGELVSENDPHGRPSMLDRLVRQGLGKSRKHGTRVHLKPVGRLDMSTEGLVVVTNDGDYARQMELPRNKFHRTYRVRAHGLLTPHKISRIQKGMLIDGIRYRGMRVIREAAGRQRRGKHRSSTNSWIRLTCVEGKNRLIRKVLEHLGLTVNRLIRVSFGDYQLESIPAGSGAIEVPVKPIADHKLRGSIAPKPKKPVKQDEDEVARSPIQWVRHA